MLLVESGPELGSLGLLIEPDPVPLGSEGVIESVSSERMSEIEERSESSDAGSTIPEKPLKLIDESKLSGSSKKLDEPKLEMSISINDGNVDIVVDCDDIDVVDDIHKHVIDIRLFDESLQVTPRAVVDVVEFVRAEAAK